MDLLTRHLIHLLRTRESCSEVYLAEESERSTSNTTRDIG